MFFGRASSAAWARRPSIQRTASSHQDILWDRRRMMLSNHHDLEGIDVLWLGLFFQVRLYLRWFLSKFLPDQRCHCSSKKLRKTPQSPHPPKSSMVVWPGPVSSKLSRFCWQLSWNLNSCFLRGWFAKWWCWRDKFGLQTGMILNLHPPRNRSLINPRPKAGYFWWG